LLVGVYFVFNYTETKTQSHILYSKSYHPKNKICDFDEMLTRFRGHFHTKIDIDPEIEVSVVPNQVFLETTLVTL